MSDAIILDLPVIMKSSVDNEGRRMVSCEVSVQKKDVEGDVILQSALLNSADSFVKNGHVDQDHVSEVGARLGIADPASYIIGVPKSVTDLGNTRTGVTFEVFRAKDGSFDPEHRKYDAFWQSLQTEPPTPWRASIYGFPTDDGLVDMQSGSVSKADRAYGATRYLVKGISWKSLAVTLNPVCQDIKGTAHIVSAKALVAIMKARGYQDAQKASGTGDLAGGNALGGMAGPPGGASTTAPAGAMPKYLLTPRNREELLGHYHGHIQKGLCPHAGGETGTSVFSLRNHYVHCCLEPEHSADVLALATMQLLKHMKRH